MDFVSHLTNNNIKPSLQRIKIFEYLYDNRKHPTVDTIYSNLVEDIPTLSKTTVYNTLKLFIDNGITATVTIEDNEVRYDAIMEEHAHFKCDTCGNVYDVEIDISTLKFKKIKAFKVETTNIYLKGKCNKC
ncbi:MAG: transcriptional repressor [Flavobacteriales bacterium]|nr:transcriptional repressor [Flavobacteriales bacterium]